MFRTALRSLSSISLRGPNALRLTLRSAARFQSSYSQIPKLKTLQEFNDKVLQKNSKGVKIVDFYATWCGPCKAIIPHISKLMNEYPDVEFYKVDVDEALDIATSCEISAMPTFMVVKDGEVTNKIVGSNPMALENGIKEAQ